MPRRPRPRVVPTPEPAGGPVDAAVEAGTSTIGLDEDGSASALWVAMASSWARRTWWTGGEGTRPRLEGRTEFVPEAGGTGAEAVATPTRPPAGHHGDPAEADGLDRGDRWPWENIRVCGRLGDARTLRKRVEPQPRALPERGVSGGSKGGGALPLASPPRSTWRGLAYNPKSVSQPLGGAAEHASPGIARNSLDRAVARQLPGLPVASLKDGKGDRPGSRFSRDCATLCRAPGFRPTLTPRRPEIVR